MPSSRTISANGIELFLLEKGEGPLVVLCHGWPELSYSWRHQIRAIAAAGYHVVAQDMRGFGRTSASANIAAYSIFDHVGDTVALVAALITGLIGAKRVADMEQVLPNLTQKRIIDGAGHGVQQERANEVNAALIAFLGNCGREKRVNRARGQPAIRSVHADRPAHRRKPA